MLKDFIIKEIIYNLILIMSTIKDRLYLLIIFIEIIMIIIEVCILLCLDFAIPAFSI